MLVFRYPLLWRLLVLIGVGALAGCTKSSGPLKLYFISSSRFTSGNRTGVGPGDTLATRLFATAAAGNTLKHFTVTVAYSPRRVPFAYPSSILSFNYRLLPNDSLITYLDSTLTNAPTEFLYTSIFGSRTTSGTEKWVFTATDKDNNTSTRTFTLAVRRADSTQVYHDYTLNLAASGLTAGAQRFIELKSGIAYPAYTVAGAVPNPAVQSQIDMLLLPDGQRLASPDDPGVTLSKWVVAHRATRFHLTTLASANDFSGVQDTLAIRQQFSGGTTSLVSGLAIGQVYAFRTADPKPYFGLLRVANVPGGTSAGLQLQVRVAKHVLGQ